MLVFGLVSPHPPIIIPDIGKDDLKNVRQTIKALEAAARDLAAAEPEELVIIAPHEGHGFEVPMYYLGQHLPDGIPQEEILVTEDSYQYYFELGKEYGVRLRKDRRRYAIVASGDLSHVLKEDGPYGFNPAGPLLDEVIVAAVRRRDAQALLDLDPATLEQGAECGLRSILFLLGAFDGKPVDTEVTSYEGPFGVGYMVATLNPGSASLSITELARESVQTYLETGKYLQVPAGLPDQLKVKAGAFVSLHAPDGELRGCIGTILPTKQTLAEEVISNAVSAATTDDRFEPITKAELEDLAISVDVLTEPELAEDLSKLDPKRDGVVVETKDGRKGVLLPDLEDVDTVAEQIEICRKKGSIGPHEPVEVYSFQVERYS